MSPGNDQHLFAAQKLVVQDLGQRAERKALAQSVSIKLYVVTIADRGREQPRRLQVVSDCTAPTTDSHDAIRRYTIRTGLQPDCQ